MPWPRRRQPLRRRRDSDVSGPHNLHFEVNSIFMGPWAMRDREVREVRNPCHRVHIIEIATEWQRNPAVKYNVPLQQLHLFHFSFSDFRRFEKKGG